jgi:streptomycin 6-kinase
MSSGPDLSQLAHTARQVASEWQVDLGEPFHLSRYSFVAPAGEDAVLKVTSPEDDESDQEADALLCWNGDGAPRLLRCAPERRAMLIERARPGTDISHLAEGTAPAIAVDLGRRLWEPAGEPYRWIGDHVPRWLANAERSAAAPDDLIRLASELYASLEPGRSTLVHGDFHHHNILAAGAGYVAIDPKPMLGEPEFDIPSFLWNPIGYQWTLEETRLRLASFAAAGLDEWRMCAWTAIRGAYLGADEHDRDVIHGLLGAAAP